MGGDDFRERSCAAPPRIPRRIAASPHEAPAAAVRESTRRLGLVRPRASGLRTTWLGHSTVLIEINGLRVITDPVWDLSRLGRGVVRGRRPQGGAEAAGRDLLAFIKA